MALTDRFVAGTAAYISFGGSAIMADYRSLDLSRAVDIVERSAGSDAAKSYITTLKDGNATLELAHPHSGTTVTGYLSKLVLGTEGTLDVGARGSAVGNPRFTINAIVTGVDMTYPYVDLAMLTISFQFSGTIINDPFTATW